MRALIAAGAVMAGISLAAPALASGDAAHAPATDWSFKGLFGTFDRGALQRGFQVYTEVCAGCRLGQFEDQGCEGATRQASR